MSVEVPSLPAAAVEPGGRTQVAPTSLVLFGVTGDLAQRKLLPALYNMAHDGALPRRFHLIGNALSPLDETEFRGLVADAVRLHSRRTPDEESLGDFLDGLRYVRGPSDRAEAHRCIAQTLQELDRAAGQPANRVFYLSTPPELFSPIVEQIGEHRLQAHDHAAVRIVIEKPFGTTLAEARAFNERVLSVFEESQVFRIDHYLGKETVQNIFALRFANSLFEPIWNRNVISSVQITVAEEIGIGARAGYYDRIGALRDVVQNHMLQLLCMVCMEPPADLSAGAVRDEKVKVLKAIKPPVPEASVRARYASGAGGLVPGYLDEPDVPSASNTETYAALRLHVDSWRWAGVPFYLRTGKRLARKETEIALTLRAIPDLPFWRGPGELVPNQLVLSVQPRQRIAIALGAKAPGSGMRIEPATLELSATTARAGEAYERLIQDAMRGDATLFTRDDEVEAQWRICDPIVGCWNRERWPPPLYAAGSQGPSEATGILLPGDAWRPI
jgi:glucose-6-phosphate 1-dehydrogenase